MKFLQAPLLAGLIFCASPAFAGAPCYTQAQMKAEQLLRLHSELMVVGGIRFFYAKKYQRASRSRTNNDRLLQRNE